MSEKNSLEDYTTPKKIIGLVEKITESAGSLETSPLITIIKIYDDPSSFLYIKSEEKIESVEFPRLLSPPEKDVILGKKVEYEMSYNWYAGFQYRLKILQGKYKNLEWRRTKKLRQTHYTY